MVGLAGKSGTGKTTLLAGLIGVLRDRKYHTGVIKHAHHGFEIDYPGKDSYELRRAGASQVFIGSSNRWAFINELEGKEPLSFQDQLLKFSTHELDIILVEGYRPEPIPKIELFRSDLNNPFLFPDDENIIAVAADDTHGQKINLPVLDLNNPGQIADFIIDRFITRNKILTQAP